MPVEDDEDNEDDVEPLQQEPPTAEDEDIDEEPLPGPSWPKRMKTNKIE